MVILIGFMYILFDIRVMYGLKTTYSNGIAIKLLEGFVVCGILKCTDGDEEVFFFYAVRVCFDRVAVKRMNRFP